VIKEYNTAFQRIFYLKNKLIGKALYNVKCGWQEPAVKKILDKMIGKGVFFKEKEFEFDVKGEKKIFSITSKYVDLNQNNESNILLTIRDITLKKEIERAKSDFASFVSHELRTPITNIKAYVQLMVQCYNEKTKCDYERYLRKTLVFADRLNELVKEFHEFNKAGADKIQIDKMNFNVDELLNDNLEATRITSPDVNIVKIGKVNIIINADPIRITQVLSNFLTNAIKYSSGKKIILKSFIENDMVLIEVTDEGIGISKEEVKKLFSRYFRAKNSAKIEGLGMGLYLAKKIIKAHKGEIGARSEVGKGSTFYFSLPVNH
jgi:PAS domain S-box-containing protein